jgi:DNA-binding transcriptional LysR family regulator
MANNLKNLDWSLIQSFISVAETGSLTQGAKQLGKSQPTMGRNISNIEAMLDTQLFNRERHGLSLTDKGEELLKIAIEMRSSAAKLLLNVAGGSNEMSGTVRVTASQVISNFTLPAILAKISAEHPNIEIELHASDDSENLLFHEADIAVRMYRPNQLDIITRHICDIEIGFFASKSYLERVGTPQTIEEMKKLNWIGYDKSELMLKGMRQFGWQVDRSFFKTRCDDQAVYWQMVKTGCGIGVGQVNIGLSDDDIVHLFPDAPIPSIPVWLTAPKALRNSARIRYVYNILAAEIKISAQKKRQPKLPL